MVKKSLKYLLFGPLQKFAGPLSRCHQLPDIAGKKWGGQLLVYNVHVLSVALEALSKAAIS